MSRARSVRAVVVVSLLIAGALVAQASPDTAEPGSLLVVLDASGSMWGRLDGEPKIVVARRVLAELAADLPDATRVGLVAYGHNREGDCDDVETVMPLGPLDRDGLRATVDGLNPKGKTPITRALGEAFSLVRGAGEPVTVVLVSDGLETCDGDPCAAVRAAKADGIPLLLHVVGFDVGDEDVSSLECAAQAGGGLYFDARDADGLGQAMDRAIELPADAPTAKLVVGAMIDGELADVSVRVRDANGEDVAGARTYTHVDTNPRAIPLPAGRYTAEIAPVRLKAAAGETFDFELADGETVEKHVDYSSGDLVLRARKNGQPMDAVARVVRAGTDDEVAIKRTYDRPEVVLSIAAGTYDVLVKPTKIQGADTTRIEGVVLEPGGRVEREVAIDTGILKVEVRVGGELGDAILTVYRADADGAVAQGRVRPAADSNPKSFEVVAGDYRVEIKADTPSGPQRHTLTVRVEPGEETTTTSSFER